MASSNRGLLISSVVILVAVCACVLAAAAVAGGAYYVYTAAATPTPAATLNPTQIADTMDTIQAYVVAHRGLPPRQPVERAFLTVDEVRQRVLDDFEDDYSPEEAADDVRVLAAFGLVKPEVDLYDLYVRLYSEGVAGFYDPDTKELVLVSETQGLNAYERVVFAHEYTHAMQDQAFDIRASGFSDEIFDQDSERFGAVQAVVEGDASLLEEQYMATLSAAEQKEYDAAVNAQDMSLLLDMPQFLLYDFIFPYDQGLAFVRRYYDEGGWARVDEVWQALPVSSEQILHPERYEAGEAPVVVARPALTDTLGSGWRQLDAGVNGEWYTYLILAHGADGDAQLADDRAKQAAEGWGGDGYVVFGREANEATVLAADWAWDTSQDADEFVEAFRGYADERFGSAAVEAGGRLCWGAAGTNCLIRNGLDTLWLMAPDAETFGAVLGQYGEFE